MKLKLLFITFAMFSLTFTMNAQDEIFWSGSSANGNWDWGSGCNAANGGNWYWNSSGVGNRQRPDCFSSSNIIKFDNGANTTMNLNSSFDFSVNQIQFLTGTSDRTINTDAGRKIIFRNNNGPCKIENRIILTTHTFNVNIDVFTGGDNMEINPLNGFLRFNGTITNNSNNPINIYGAQQVTFDGNIAGNPGITINNTATVVYTGISKTYTGTTTINSGTRLRISSNQTLGNIELNGGRLEIDAGVTLTITGTYTSTGGTIVNNGIIKFAGSSVTFPGNATVNNGTANTLVGFEAASSGTVTLNTILRVTNAITVSSGTLLLTANDLRLNNATLNIATGGTFDNGGENQIIPEGSGAINITGTFITRDKDGFVGSTTAIPSITPTLNAGSTVEYGLNGNQDVQGSRSYFNLTFSNSGTKSLSSSITNTNTITGIVTIKDSSILNVGNLTLGGPGTNLTMTGTSEYITAGTGTRPDADGTYNLIGGVVKFANNSGTAQTIKNKSYQNIEVTGSNVGNSSGNITLNANGTFTVKNGGTFTINADAIVGPSVTGTETVTVENGGTFKTGDADGFNGGTNTSIRNDITTIALNAGSTVEYSRNGDQIITLAGYSNLTVSGTLGIKTLASTSATTVGNNLSVTASTLRIESGKALTVTNSVKVNAAATMIIENSGSLVQVNDAAVNSGNIRYERTTPPVTNTDYTYWSSPVEGYTLGGVSQNKTVADKYYSYNSTTETWDQKSALTPMDPGIGYIIRGPEPTPPDPPSPANFNAFFVGKPNNGQYTISGHTILKCDYIQILSPLVVRLAREFLPILQMIMQLTMLPEVLL